MKSHISRLLLLAALWVCLWCTACGTGEKNVNTSVELNTSANVTVRVNAFAGAPEATTVTVLVGDEEQTYQAVAGQTSIDLGEIEVGTSVRASVTSDEGISKVDILVDNCFRDSDICDSTGCSASAAYVIADQACLN